MKNEYRVGEVAAISGVSVRTLHYYESMGLLVPDKRTAAGYRLYSGNDLLRLQQILINRELGLSLESIKRLLDEPNFDRRLMLLQQREQLLQRAEQTTAMITAVDTALAALDYPATEDGNMVDFKQIFAGFHPQQYEAEVEQRWGSSDGYKRMQLTGCGFAMNRPRFMRMPMPL